MNKRLTTAREQRARIYRGIRGARRALARAAPRGQGQASAGRRRAACPDRPDGGAVRLPGLAPDGAAARARQAERLGRPGAAGAAHQHVAAVEQLPRRSRGVEVRRGTGRPACPESPAAVDRPRPGAQAVLRGADRLARRALDLGPDGATACASCGARATSSWYEPVIVGSFEDAVLAVLVNYNIQAVVMFDGFGYASQTPLADLRELIAAYLPQAAAARDGDLAMLLSRAVRAIRPELDVYLSTDRDVARARGRRRGGGNPARVLRAGGDARAAPRDPRRHQGSL